MVLALPMAIARAAGPILIASFWDYVGDPQAATRVTLGLACAAAVALTWAYQAAASVAKFRESGPSSNTMQTGNPTRIPGVPEKSGALALFFFDLFQFLLFFRRLGGFFLGLLLRVFALAHGSSPT